MFSTPVSFLPPSLTSATTYYIWVFTHSPAKIELPTCPTLTIQHHAQIPEEIECGSWDSQRSKSDTSPKAWLRLRKRNLTVTLYIPVIYWGSLLSDKWYDIVYRYTIITRVDSKLNRNTGYQLIFSWAAQKFTGSPRLSPSLNRDNHLYQSKCSCTVLTCTFQTFLKETDTNHTAANIASPNREKKHGFFNVTQTLNCDKLIKKYGLQWNYLSTISN
jgi:hypothetical protein